MNIFILYLYTNIPFLCTVGYVQSHDGFFNKLHYYSVSIYFARCAFMLVLNKNAVMFICTGIDHLI